MPSPDTLARFIARVESNAHAEAIEEFYTTDASMRENLQAPRRGRDALVANERKVLARMKSVRSRCVRPVLASGDTVVVRWIFEFETLDGGRIRMEELAWQRWEGERIAEEQFFYDPKQLEAAAPLFSAGAWRAVEMGEPDAAELQAFFEANPDYFIAVHGVPATPTEAHEELHPELPPGFSCDKHWPVKLMPAHGPMVAMANVSENMLAKDVWHVGLFIVATKLHGSGAAREIYSALEAWMRSRGAKWLRLGVVAGNRRAERFWESLGYRETRKRLGLTMGARVNDLRVMAKPLAGGTLAEYLALVARDRPETP
jgi:GNAT superfamily N-acetyltransferase